MAIKVHGNLISTATIRVIGCLNEKGLDYELVPVDMKAGQHKKEPFLSLNPFGQVPAFEDGDLLLFESRAITSYIAHAYAGSGNQLIVLDDPKKMATVSVWMDVEAHQFDAPASNLKWELRVKPMIGSTPDEAVVEAELVKLSKVLDIYEARLSESKYLGGDCFTLADLHHLPNLSNLKGTKVDELFDSRPNVRAWADDIQARPAWSKLVEQRKQQLLQFA